MDMPHLLIAKHKYHEWIACCFYMLGMFLVSFLISHYIKSYTTQACVNSFFSAIPLLVI